MSSAYFKPVSLMSQTSLSFMCLQELRLAHTLENGNRLRVSADLQTAAVSFGFDFPF